MGDDVDAAPRVERAKLDPARRAASLKKRMANRDRGGLGSGADEGGAGGEGGEVDEDARVDRHDRRQRR